MARVQRLCFADRPDTYRVVGGDQLPVAPAREYLQFLADRGASPNTVRAYAYGLAAWWSVLEHTNTAWDDFPTSLFGQFLSYLRTGDLPGTARIGDPEPGMAESALQPRGAAVLSMYRYFADAHDLDRPYRRLFSSHARTSRSRYAPTLSGIGPQRDRDVPLHRRRAPSRTETPVLLPVQVNAILDGCSVQSASGEWTGSAAGLRDRLFFAVLAETGMRMGEALSLRHNDFHISGGGTPSIAVAGRDDHPHGVRAKSGARRIYIGDDLVALYSEYVWQLVGWGADIAVDDLATHFVFVNLARGQRYAPLRPETIYDKVETIRTARADVLPQNWTPHWLRHTHATALLLSGVREHVVMRRLGHADVQTTLSIYGWVTADAEMRSVAEWKNYVAGWKVSHDPTS
ncbi:tyrosine-type recombinase/integrase [Mycolicibacterium pyrenivorans]|uniref:tyrosine-type recombinase/integrase n=1 Tax=Mycolicibacterium pyrenivorans TaxID=187102 RepID=UPI0021F3C637|nr:tyrosine-type recombinase/integrase [Mycolicibacterium pyrenivorans]MCV7154001.1 tyrosine-type recombinase/integrase [Mycolicibacterium pyrenivorans]